MIQWRDNGGLNQQWAVSDAGGGFRKLVSRLSGKALDVSATSTAIQSTDAGTTDQQWQLIAG